MRFLSFILFFLLSSCALEGMNMRHGGSIDKKKSIAFAEFINLSSCEEIDDRLISSLKDVMNKNGVMISGSDKERKALKGRRRRPLLLGYGKKVNSDLVIYGEVLECNYGIVNPMENDIAPQISVVVKVLDVKEKRISRILYSSIRIERGLGGEFPLEALIPKITERIYNGIFKD